MKTSVWGLGLLCAISWTAGGHANDQSAGSEADQQLRALYTKEWEWRQATNAQERDDEGGWRRADHYPDVSADSYAERLAYWDSALGKLADIDRESLGDEERINAAVFEQIVTTLASNARYRTFEAPLNSDTFFWGGLHPQAAGFDTYADYRRYVGRLNDLPSYFAQHQENMRAGLARGYTPAAISLAGRDDSIAAYIVEGEENPFAVPLAHFPPSMTAAQREEISQAVIEAINQSAVPAYADLLAFMTTEYLPKARTSLAAVELPDGEAFYQAQIRAFTTLDLSADEIHKQGLAEVARIRAAMEDIVEEVEFDGDMAEFFHFLRTDPQFYAKTPDELMGVSAYVDKRMAAQIDKVLGFLPRKRHTISPVPDAIAPIYTAGRGGYGRCLMNTYNLPARPLYALPALTLHECSPGHSLQAAISREAPGDIPEFRAYNYFSGYGEGWGLYTEWLGGEVGIYRTPYERFGQLTYEMWRAARLVIDTGIHQYGWSREKAQDYLRSNAALSEHEIVTEIDRYISWPGQALAYKLGEMLIREKRAKAEAELGTDFDQRYFHDRILGLRSVPLWLLADELDDWIAAGGPNPYEGMELD
ncbi:DUF885 domain-containing protein [Halioglobus pacificus]|uniref:DUF885 domain-containing protein n=1 Tax=Parahalioglobus pacificus TaxID=930806 RepID=A0A919CKX2_9GAMM|nr:DUF885 family protein [Halioglobus pacificus]GHD32172.1 hypothetical protein GCM10007053_16000 [Halioglobus pacificus]